MLNAKIYFSSNKHRHQVADVPRLTIFSILPQIRHTILSASSTEFDDIQGKLKSLSIHCDKVRG